MQRWSAEEKLERERKLLEYQRQRDLFFHFSSFKSFWLNSEYKYKVVFPFGFRPKRKLAIVELLHILLSYCYCCYLQLLLTTVVIVALNFSFDSHSHRTLHCVCAHLFAYTPNVQWVYMIFIYTLCTRFDVSPKCIVILIRPFRTKRSNRRKKTTTTKHNKIWCYYSKGHTVK